MNATNSNKPNSTKSIALSQHYQLVGLMTLAAQHNQALHDIEKAALAITGEVADYGHTTDAVQLVGTDGTTPLGTANDLLDKLRIGVHDDVVKGEQDESAQNTGAVGPGVDQPA